MTTDEQVECEQAVIKDPNFMNALKKHGVNDPSLVMVDMWSAGFFNANPANDVPPSAQVKAPGSHTECCH